jgi:YVTN family beta-propeller protein
MKFQITYQGRLADSSVPPGPIANQTVNLVFRIYEQPSGGTAIWTSPVTPVQTDANGLFTTQLTIDPPLKQGGVLAINNLWLSIQAGSDAEMTPRQQLTGAPYAFTLIPGAGISGTVGVNDAPGAMLVINNSGTGAGLIVRSEQGAGAMFTSGENHALVVGGSVLMEGANLRRIALHRWYEVNEAGMRFPVGGEPKGILFDGMSVWVSNSISNTVTRRLTSDGSLIGTYPVGQYPIGMAFDGARLWVACRLDNTVHVLRMSNGLPLFTVPVGTNPNGVAFDGRYIWVVNEGSNNVTKIMATSGTVVGTYPCGNSPRLIAYDGSKIWVTNEGSDTVTVLNRDTGATITSYATGDAPVGIIFDGACLWIANSGSNNVTRLRASDGALLGTYPVGGEPRGLAFDGGHIWVTNYATDSVTKLRARDGSLVGTYDVGNGPRGISFDGCNMWVVNGDEANLVEL